MLVVTHSWNLSDLAPAKSWIHRPTLSWMLKPDSEFAGSSTGVFENAYAKLVSPAPFRMYGFPSKSVQLAQPVQRAVNLKCVSLTLVPLRTVYLASAYVPGT